MTPPLTPGELVLVTAAAVVVVLAMLDHFFGDDS